jgi:peptidyl-prolyl cis-trans isomerase SurA
MPLIFKRILFAAILLAAPGAFGQTTELSSTGVLLDRIAAVVNDGIVLQGDVEKQVQVVSQRLTQAGKQLPPRNVLYQQVLERQILQELQLQRAARLEMQVSDEMLNQALAEVAERNKISFADMPAALAAQGIDYGEYREEVRREMTLTMLKQRDVLARVYISPREVDQCVAERKESPGRDDAYNLAHILIAIPTAASADEIAERSARAMGVYERARQGEDFAQLAITYSDSGSALEGGNLGWRQAGQLPSFVAEIIPGMAVGEVTEPLRTPSGLNIFKLLDKRGETDSAMVEQVHARHILMQTNELEDDSTVSLRLNEIRDRILAGEDFAAIASVTSDDPGSAASGGDLGWTGPGTFVPEFAMQLDALDVNEISPAFKTQYGWHIVQLLGKRTYDATDDMLKRRCAMQLREAKLDEETEIWLRRIRDEAYVDYRM